MNGENLIDNRGLSCPQPVINTKKALEEKSTRNINIISVVDNETAAENVTRFAKNSGCEVQREDKLDGIYLTIEIRGEGISTPGEKESAVEVSSSESENLKKEQNLSTVLLVTSSALGSGSEELGRILMQSYFYSLAQSDSYPGKIVFINSGVFLTAEGTPIKEELNYLQQRGVEIFSCGTCLDYYGIKDKLEIGAVTNMYDIVEHLSASTKCITL